ncbi:hypothetical protein, partial [uncultured Paenibacillus sp.]|uniref:hypothetical protein n=1 Tax=uncultured Paenibacillus sp. TaxID=227322 RepID=UPI002805B604
APTGLSSTAVTAAGNDGTITGVNSEMEYRLKDATDWTNVTGTEIMGLAAGTYEVRYAATTGFNTGAVAEVPVLGYQVAPTGLSSTAVTAAGNDGTITGVNSEMEYRLKDATDWTNVTGTEIMGLAAGTYEVRYAATTGFNTGAVAEVPVLGYQVAPTGLSSTAVTAAGNDGTITGVNSEMEYRLKDAADWTNVTGTEIMGLAAGTYEVRYAAKEGFNAGAVTEVPVAADETP